MPTVGEFVRAAALLEHAAAHARTLLSPVSAAMGPEVLTGGVLSKSTDSAITARQAEAHALAAELSRLADDCRFRAAVVTTAAAEAAAYSEAVSRYRSRRVDFERRLHRHEANPHTMHPGRAPQPPAAPPPAPSWADF